MDKDLKLALRLYGIKDRSHTDALALLTAYATCPTLTQKPLTPQEFLRALYKQWNQLDKRRTTRYLEREAKLVGVHSAYHRITGRLRLSMEDCGTLINLMLKEWNNKIPSALHEPSFVHKFVNWLYGSELQIKDRITNQGLNASDLESLLKVQQVIGRPIQLKEIIPTLSAVALCKQE